MRNWFQRKNKYKDHFLLGKMNSKKYNNLCSNTWWKNMNSRGYVRDKIMQAERIILETDHLGNLKEIPKLPPNKQIEAIFLVVSDCSELPIQSQRSPHPDIVGKLEISGNIFDSASTSFWNLNDDRT